MNVLKTIPVMLKKICIGLILLLVSISTFAAQHDVEIQHADAVNLTKPTMKATGKDFDLTLQSANSSINFSLTKNTRLVEGLPPKQMAGEITLYKGSIIGNPRSWARFTSVNGQLTGAFYDGQELHFVKRAASLIDSVTNQVMRQALLNQPEQLAMYSAADVVHSGTCASPHDHVQNIQQFDYQGMVNNLSQSALAAATQSIEVALVADVEYDQDNNGNGLAQMLAEMNIVDGIFSEQVNVALSIVDTRVLSDNGTLTSTNAFTLIDQFQSFVTSDITNPGVTHLFTGRDFDGSTAGIAYVGAICSSFGVGITQNFGSVTSLIAAHEFGHNFGAPHDNQNGSACASTAGTFLMNPSINGSDQFSACSLSQIANEVSTARCLIDNDITPPTITSQPNLEAEQDIAYLYDQDNTVEASGAENITFSLVNGPSGMTVSTNGLVEWTPTAQQVGIQLIEIEATNAFGSDFQTFEVDVAPAIPFIDFSEQTVLPYGIGQDIRGDVAIVDDGSTLNITGNRWKHIPFDYDIQPNTVLTFEFTSNQRGEIHGIGLDTDTRISRDRTFQVYGSQRWGTRDFSYSGNGQTQTFVIPIGQYYTGQTSNIFFVMDHDVGNPTGQSIFTNVAVYEPPVEEPPVDSEFLNFNLVLNQSYGGNQDGAGTIDIQDAGLTLRLSGNRWRKIDFPIDIVATTVLEFEYKSENRGEIHGIGFDNDNGINANKTFQLEGSQNWGNKTYQYTGNGEFQKFTIPVGQFYTGSQNVMFFVLDHDVQNPTATAYFRNIVVR